MKRRKLLGGIGGTFAVGIAGCSDDTDEDDPGDPEPAASELRIAVENSDSRTHSITFVLRTTRDQTTFVEGFDSGEIGPGETWSRDPETLEPGSYELEIQMTTLDAESTPTWVGRECPVKEIDIELREDGFRIRSLCPEDSS